MVIELANSKEKQQILKYDKHIPSSALGECIYNNFVYVLKDDSIKNGGVNHRVKNPVVGVLRYSMFWQTIPMLDLIYIDEEYQHKGYGTQMMAYWEEHMKLMGYKHLMTSTQADETAWEFYEKIGFHKAGSFSCMVPMVGVEPTRYRYHGILRSARQ